MKTELNNLEIMRRMREACKVTKDSELAQFTGETPSSVSSWKRIKSPPYAACLVVARKTGVPMEWLLLGEGKTGGAEYKRAKGLTQNEFVEKYIKSIRMAEDLEIIEIAKDATDIELSRYGNYLFNETREKEDEPAKDPINQADEEPVDS